jgi:hypothetical protein
MQTGHHFLRATETPPTLFPERKLDELKTKQQS